MLWPSVALGRGTRTTVSVASVGVGERVVKTSKVAEGIEPGERNVNCASFSGICCMCEFDNTCWICAVLLGLSVI